MDLITMIPDLIYDVGLHEGADTAYYLAKGFRVVAIDANPYLCEKARHLFADAVSQQRLTILNMGISDHPDEAKFFIARNKTDWSSFIESFASRYDGDVESVSIQCDSLDAIMRRYGIPYYCKIDIEGHDRLAVLALARLDEFPRYVSVEATVGDFASLLSPLGYRWFKMINQVHIGRVPPVFPPLEGLFTSMPAIPGKSSGPFGDETYGPWLTAEEFMADYGAALRNEWTGTVQQQAGVAEDISGAWKDFHAKLG